MAGILILPRPPVKRTRGSRRPAPEDAGRSCGHRAQYAASFSTSKKEKNPTAAEEPKKLCANELENVVGGVKIVPDAEITPVKPKTETQAVKPPIKINDPKPTVSTEGDIVLPEIP